MRFWLGTHQVDWLGRTRVPLFVSARRLRQRVRLPRAAGPWALDSGGFSELAIFSRWVTPATQYASEVREWADRVGGLEWAAAQDWMCEPFVTAKTGLSVPIHQQLTVDNYLLLKQLAPDMPWVPVVQGYRPAEYLDCVRLYEGAGIDLRALPLVGVGSVCRRQGTAEAEAIFRGLAGMGLRLHGFGVKANGLMRFANALASADSMAWSFAARRRPVRLPGCPHRTCANCRRWAVRWRRDLLRRVRAARNRPRQLFLFE